ncbi:MAG: hypothetical protein ACO3E0_08450 [Candidatus Kapaibacteriota bacterium]
MMKTTTSALSICLSMLAVAQMSAQPPHLVRPIDAMVTHVAGVARSSSVLAVIGLRLPARAPTQAATDSTRDRVPDYLGSTIQWSAYTVDGRAAGRGTRVFRPSDARTLSLSVAEVHGPGLRMVVCRGVGSAVIWRTRLWISE